ncbi:MAG: hypothetical protein JW966_12215 [Anaerolineae bacterium]|nr:hypothetical protein [Anaerolineae bacterium]
MRRSVVLLVLFLSLVWPLAPDTVSAQADPDAWIASTQNVNLRTAPAPDAEIITSLAPGTGLLLEARSADSAWLLVQSVKGVDRGWIMRDLLRFRAGLSVADLPVSDMVIDLDAERARLEERAAAVDLAAYPVIPGDMGQARAVFVQGQALGRDSAVVSKVGDCNSSEWRFLHPFGEAQYDLAEHADLQRIVDRFGVSLGYRTYAAHNGLNAMAVLDSLWASPSACRRDETPLACEYRVHNPAVAMIMFGTNDLIVLDAWQFDHYLRRVIDATLEAGVIPVLSTFPRHLAFPDRSILFNQIVVLVAQDYDIPLINLWLALEPLPNHGIAPDGFHLSSSQTSAGDMSGDNLLSGYPMRNYVTLRALDVVWRQAMQP